MKLLELTAEELKAALALLKEQKHRFLLDKSRKDNADMAYGSGFNEGLKHGLSFAKRKKKD